MTVLVRWLLVAGMSVALSSCFISNGPLLSAADAPLVKPVPFGKFAAVSVGENDKRYYIEVKGNEFFLAENEGEKPWAVLTFTPFKFGPDDPPAENRLKPKRFVMQLKTLPTQQGDPNTYAYFAVEFVGQGTMIMLGPKGATPLTMCDGLTNDQRKELQLDETLVGCGFKTFYQLMRGFQLVDASRKLDFAAWFHITALDLDIPAQAAAAGPFTRCDDATALLNLDALKDRIVSALPARYAQAIKGTQFASTSSSEHVGPYADPSNPKAYRIIIPEPFLKNQCKISYLEYISHWAEEGSPAHVTRDDADERVKVALKDCVDKTGRIPDCFSKGLDAAIAANRPQLASLTPENIKVVELILQEAVKRLVFHEVGHIVLGHLQRPPKPNDEYDADSFALFYGSAGGTLPGTNTAIYSAYDVLDEYKADKTDLHGSFFCRFFTGWLVEDQIGALPVNLLGATNSANGRTDHDAMEEFRRSLTEGDRQKPFDLKAFNNMRLACPVVTRWQHTAVPLDLEKLTKLVTGNFSVVDAINGGGDAGPFVRQILALPLSTPEGKSLAFKIAVGLIDNSTFTWKSEDWRSKGIDRLADAVIRTDRDLDMDARSYGNVLRIRAMGRYYTAPQDTPDVIARTASDLKLARAYIGEEPNLLAMLGYMEIESGDCDSGIADYAAGVRSSEQDGVPNDTAKQIGELLPKAKAKLGCGELGKMVPYLIGRRPIPQGVKTP